jgi:hypothetical protein
METWSRVKNRRQGKKLALGDGKHTGAADLIKSKK